MTAEEVIEKHEICYAYNDSFGFYHKTPMTREECVKFVNSKNECKGGHWIVRPKGQHQKHFEFLQKINLLVRKRD